MANAVVNKGLGYLIRYFNQSFTLLPFF